MPESGLPQILIDRGWLTPMEVQEALAALDAVRASGLAIELDEILLRRGAVTLEQLAIARSLAKLPPSPVIPDYEILGRLGEGGMGTVYKARSIRQGRTVAVKVLTPSFARERDAVDRFLREARMLVSLKHPNLVAGIDAGYSHGLYYVVMECVEGTTLGRILDRCGAMAWKQALSFVRSIAEALAYAESQGVLHRDIKPENILIDYAGQARLSDLGVAKFVSDSSPAITTAGSFVGTPAYMSPEQLQGRNDLDSRSDIYSLGLTLFEMLCGKPAFEAPTTAELMAKRFREKPHYGALARVPEAVVAVVRKMTAENRATRYRRVSELIVDLDQLLADRPVVFAMPVVKVARRSTDVRRKKPLRLVVLLLLLAAAATVKLFIRA
jgi:serine/threonine protein kinase